MEELIKKILDHLNDDNATIGFRKEGEQYSLVFFSDERESFPMDGASPLELLQDFARKDGINFSELEKPRLSAAEKRIYLNAFAHACLVADLDTPVRAAYKAVMLFRGEGDEGPIYPQAIDMWKYMRECALGL